MIDNFDPTNPSTVSVILPVIDETSSLEKTVEVLVSENAEALKEILIVVASHTTPRALEIALGLQNSHRELVRVHQQSLPHLGGALREAFDLADGEYTVLMASDLETNPHVVRKLIEEMSVKETDIIVASRWLNGAGFAQYGVAKIVLNFLFQKVFCWLYRVSLSDLTYAFRIYRTDILQSIKWEELRHPFLLEVLLRPLRLGYNVVEIPCKWERRTEGRSHNSLSSYLGYLRVGCTIRFARKRDMLRD